MKEFDEKAATWDEDPLRVDRAKIIASRLRKKLGNRNFKHGMEYGSGTGLLGFEMFESIEKLVLMDESIEMTNVANTKIENKKLIKVKAEQMDLINDPLPSEKFDLIFTMLTFHHILDTDRILQKFHEITSPNAVLAIIDLEKEDGSFHTGDFHGHLGFEQKDLEDHLNNNGFKPIDYSTIYTIEKQIDNKLMKSFPVFLSLSRKK
jgi:ubiquinone/menaquinone biosynthesis C-methylase UbiE